MIHQSTFMVDNLVIKNSVNKRTVGVNFRCSVLESVIETIKLIGRQGLKFRGRRDKA